MPFDPEELTLSGSPVPVVQGVAATVDGAAQFAVVRNGTLAYELGGPVGGGARFVWVDRRGREELLPLTPDNFQEFDLSPEGTRVAVRVVADDSAVWIYSLTRTSRLVGPTDWGA